MALSSCPIAFSNKSNVFTNAHRPAWVYVYTQGCRKPAMDRVYSSNNHGCTHFYSRFILAFLCTEKNMRIKIGNDSIRCVYIYIHSIYIYLVYIQVVHSRIKAFNIGKRIDTRSDRKRSDSVVFLLFENGSCYRFVRYQTSRGLRLLDFC